MHWAWRAPWRRAAARPTAWCPNAAGPPLAATWPARGLIALPRKQRILARGFHEAIGLKIDSKRGRVYVSDLGGSIYRCDTDGSNKKRIFDDASVAFTGLTVL